jgi:hypothetical protein
MTANPGPLVGVLSQAERPRTLLEWLRRPNRGGHVLRKLAAAGIEPTHEALDAFPETKVNPRALRDSSQHPSRPALRAAACGGPSSRRQRHTGYRRADRALARGFTYPN